MVSITAGSAKCGCNNPDTCIHRFTLQVNGQSYDYKQRDFAKTINVINESPRPLPMSLTLVGKGCVSHNPECPKGLIYDTQRPETLKEFTAGSVSYAVDYDRTQAERLRQYDYIGFLIQFALNPRVLDELPINEYLLRVGECAEQSFVEKPITFMDFFLQILSPKNDRLYTSIKVYPSYNWQANLVIGRQQALEEYTERGLKKEAQKLNKANGVGQRGHRGWTKLPKGEITDKLEIKGELVYHFAGDGYTESLLKTQALKHKIKQLPVLGKGQALIKTLQNALSTSQKPGEKITLLKTEILYPTLELSGGGQLKQDSQSGEVYIENAVKLGLTPLIGIKMTLDLIQAFAAWYKVDVLVAAVREGMLAKEEAVKEGKDGAFAGITFQLCAEAQVNLALSLQSDAKNQWTWQASDSIASQISLTLEVNLRVGARFYVAYGALAIGGKSVAVGFFGLGEATSAGIPLIFYHDGITAKVYVSYTVGLGRESKKEGVKAGDRHTKATASSSKQDIVKTVEKEWLIYDKLEKEKSPHRIMLG